MFVVSITAMLHRHTRLLISAPLLLLAACGGLAGEPPIIATLPPATAQPVTVATAPDLAAGARIFAENCTRCHGVGGRGDGPLVGTSEGQINPPPQDFTDPATTQELTPLAWFNIITNGKLERLMPPWRDALTEEERWAVAMYTYSLHYQPEQFAAGESLWTEQAQINITPLPQADMVQLTDNALVATVAESAGKADFLNTLDENQRQAAAAYLRSQTLTNIEVIGQPLTEIAQAATAESQPSQPSGTTAATPETTAPASAAGTISGTISNGTAGGTVPADLTVTLRELDENFNEVTRETPANATGTFTFNDVTLRADRNYVVTTEYQNRIFGSNIVAGDPANPALDLPLTIYEQTSDAGVIQITGLVTQLVAANGSLQIAQVFSFANTSDRVFTSAEPINEDQYASVSVTIPAGAQLSGFADNQQRYIISDDGTTVTDTSPVLPGEGHIFHVLYTLPYSGDLQIAQPLNYAVAGPVRLLVTPSTIAVTSAQLPSLGPQTLRNFTYQGYGGDLTLPAGETIRYQVRGLPSDTATTTETPQHTAGQYGIIRDFNRGRVAGDFYRHLYLSAWAQPARRRARWPSNHRRSNTD
ncbi:MAG TPA: cytochrome c [Phototrophicaceae bacterium]|nr:cytochrome c [Phototrophicaceae bacterium]